VLEKGATPTHPRTPNAVAIGVFLMGFAEFTDPGPPKEHSCEGRGRMRARVRKPARACQTRLPLSRSPTWR
jgi:hypothetical protein